MFASIARDYERDAISNSYGGIQALQTAWKQWLELGPTREWSRRLWITRLLGVLRSTGSLHSQDPERTGYLPPVFALCLSDLLVARHNFNILVVAASLRSLVPVLPKSVKQQVRVYSPGAVKDDEEMVERWWALLGGSDLSRAPTVETQLPADGLAMADEIIRAHNARQSYSPNNSTRPKEETAEALRHQAKRILEDEHHLVRTLLHKRLLEALIERLVSEDFREPAVAPLQMRSGRTLKPLGPTRLLTAAEADEAPIVIPGFDEPFLRREITKLVHHLRVNVIGWVDRVWGDVIQVHAV